MDMSGLLEKDDYSLSLCIDGMYKVQKNTTEQLYIHPQNSGLRRRVELVKVPRGMDVLFIHKSKVRRDFEKIMKKHINITKRRKTHRFCVNIVEQD
ncbi:hypothetical protein AX774_g5005 [Zancudomyces culisetae]|uniref:Uncharacterized protein n=1 Tax=Zancudomyces culisetae TaxID=1213189 RepID=A0A1R1PHU4_ZANCU|nr:hypothetical protein AX774_g6038 [Zancudomyces culisetae]OMH81530.1 hypothetical protein AX774_g5005 [Zancudomyces culisetae]|eukprot:OMH80518.1 hypothetical protein AX774_g6038 [Zancudomyces culisetae]